MERLTKRLEDGQAIFHECHGTCGTCDGANCYCIGPMVDRLAAYEDTGLEPQDIISAVDMAKIACALHELNAYKDIGPIDHIRDLLQAEQDGRLVVLPFELHSSMMNLSDPKNPGLMNDVRLSVSWTTSGIVFNAPYDFFLQDMKRGYIKPVSKEAEAALAGKGGSE